MIGEKKFMIKIWRWVFKTHYIISLPDTSCYWKCVFVYVLCIFNSTYLVGLLSGQTEVIYVGHLASTRFTKRAHTVLAKLFPLTSLSIGDSDHNWKIGHVTLQEDKKFRYLFQGTRGDPQNSLGGIFLDDITLTETPCPAGVWTVRNFSQVLQETALGDRIQSPRFYNSEGYAFGVSLFPHGRLTSTRTGYVGLTFHLCSGENDAILEWPVENRQAIMTILDQEPDVMNRMSSSMVLTTSSLHTSSGGSFEHKWELFLNPKGRIDVSLNYVWECNSPFTFFSLGILSA